MENTLCDESTQKAVEQTNKPTKHWLVHFITPNQDGWAVVNAPSVSLAQGIFLRQTRFPDAKITGLEELRFFGEEWQIVCEGACGRPQIKNPL